MTGTSVRGGQAGSVVGSQNAAGEGGEEEDDDDEDEVDGDDMLEGGVQDEEEHIKAEESIRWIYLRIRSVPVEHETTWLTRHRILLEKLDSDQTDRYTIFRRIKLRREIVRKVRTSSSLSTLQTANQNPRSRTKPSPSLSRSPSLSL
jgi:transcription initiation factor TFIID subunit 11